MKGLYKAIGASLLGAYASLSSGCNAPAKADEIKTQDSLPVRIAEQEALYDALVADNTISPSRKYTVKDEKGVDVTKRTTNEYAAVTDARKDVAELQTEAKGTAYEGRTNDLADRLAKIEEQVDNGNGIKAFAIFTIKENDGSLKLHGANLGQPFYVTGSKKEIADLLGEKMADLKIQYNTPASEMGYAKGTNINDKEAEIMANTVDVPLELRTEIINKMDGTWTGDGRKLTQTTMRQYLSGNQIVQMRVGFVAEATSLEAKPVEPSAVVAEPAKPADTAKPAEPAEPEPVDPD